MKQEVKKVTPEMAKEYLRSNTINRPLSVRNVEFLVKEIKEGRWKVTHQGICFSSDGVLIDGQHRLQAIIKSKTPIDILVTEGLDREIFKFVDVGKKRMSEDIFSIEGFRYSNELPSLIKRIMYWNDGVSISTRNGNNDYDIQSLLDFATANEIDLYDALSYSKKHKSSVYPRSLSAFIYWLFSRKSNKMLDDLLDQLVTGKSIDPYIISLRDELTDLKIKRLSIDAQVLLTKSLHTILCSILQKKKRLPEESNNSVCRDLLGQITIELRQ